MKLEEIHQIWLRSTPLPEEAENTRKFAEEHNIPYVLWDWEKLRKKFTSFDFFQEDTTQYPAKYLWLYAEQFYTMLLPAEYRCFVVNAFTEFNRDINNLQDTADIYLGGSAKSPSINILGIPNLELANIFKNSIIGQYNLHSDIIKLEKESLLTPMTGGNFISRKLFPIIHINKADFAYFSDIPSLDEAPVIKQEQKKDEKEEDKEEKQSVIECEVNEALPVTADIALVHRAEANASDKETLDPFWLPTNAKRIIIISNDVENIDDFVWQVGDCAIHMNEAVFAANIAVSTVCTHILFIDMYPRARMRVPSDFKQYRNIVFYDKRVRKDWKNLFLQQSGRMPSLLCCLVTEFHAAYPALPIHVLGADLSKRSTTSVLEHKRFERMWMSQLGAYLTGARYRCMLLLYKLREDENGMKAQYDTWMKKLPEDFICKFVCDTQPEFDKTAAITVSKDVRGKLQFSDVIMQALNWNWDYLFIGTDAVVVHPDRFEKCLSTVGDKTGHVRIFNGKPFYMLQAGFILSRTVVTSIPLQERNLKNISAVATVNLHDLDFVPFHQYKKEGAEWVTLGSMTPEEILSSGE